MMGEKRGGQSQFFYRFNLDNHIPQDHFLRQIDGVLDLSQLRQHLAPYYSHTGRPSIDPELMVRMLHRKLRICQLLATAMLFQVQLSRGE